MFGKQIGTSLSTEIHSISISVVSYLVVTMFLVFKEKQIENSTTVQKKRVTLFQFVQH